MALCQIKNIVLSDAFTVYNVDTKHGFAEIEKHMDKLKNLAGPVYDIESAHHFNGLTERMETLKNLKGPVYHIENQHHFNEFEKQVKGNPIRENLDVQGSANPRDPGSVNKRIKSCVLLPAAG